MQDVDRKYMELAIAEAQKSLVEDGRIHPKVGVVIVKAGEVIATSYRGETGPGNHAEFSALEKKLENETVAGGTVYTTLEPCTTRQHPKLACAQRLVERKVQRVVIGMLDPNPNICGRGQQLLRSANIATEFFPHDLMSIVEDMNREFIRMHSSAASHATGSQMSILDAWLTLKEQKVQLGPLYGLAGQSPPDPWFRVEEVTNSDVKFFKFSKGQEIHLPLFCLSYPWGTETEDGIRAKIEKGRLEFVKFDSNKQQWVYKL